MKNIVTIDVEDWHQLIHRRITGRLCSPTDNVFRQLDTVLGLLDDGDTKATFFVLGMLAQQYPDLVKRVANEGHEIACHSYAHQTIDQLSRQQFEADTRRAKDLLEDISGKPIYGYRAPEFSICVETLWALEVLSELGFEYDSSIFPIHHRRYGIADFSPQITRYDLRNGLQITEIPLATLPLANLNVPVAGGGYFRFMPQWLISRLVERMTSDCQPVVNYFHPYEFDAQRLSVFDLVQPYSWRERLRAWKYNAHQNVGRPTMPAKLGALLDEFQSTTCKEFLDGAEPGTSQTLFSTESR